MFDETRLSTPYFQQMTFRSKNWVECELFWSWMSIILEILERNVICWKYGVTSLVSLNIGDASKYLQVETVLKSA